MLLKMLMKHQKNYNTFLNNADKKIAVILIISRLVAHLNLIVN